MLKNFQKRVKDIKNLKLLANISLRLTISNILKVFYKEAKISSAVLSLAPFPPNFCSSS